MRAGDCSPLRDDPGRLDRCPVGLAPTLRRRIQLRRPDAVVGDKLGQLGVMVRGPSHDPGRRSVVQPRPLGSWQRGVGDLANQLVAEGIATPTLREALLDQRLGRQGREDFVDGLAKELGQGLGEESRSENRRVLDRALLGRPEEVEPRRDRRLDRLRQPAPAAASGSSMIRQLTSSAKNGLPPEVAATFGASARASSGSKAVASSAVAA